MNSNEQKENKRILAVYDTATQPFSIGDLIFFTQVAIIKKQNYNVDKVDFCFLFSEERAAVPELDAFITHDSKYYNLFSILPIVQFNPYIGNIFIFENKKEFYDFIAFKKNYYIWPSLDSIETGEYYFYKSYRLFAEYCRLNESFPALHIGSHLKSWALRFFKIHANQNLPVTLNLRNNPDIWTERNSNYEVWAKFFEYCENKYPVKFFIVCGTSEIDESLKRFSNVLFVKEFYTQLDKEIALLSMSPFHVGGASGPAAVSHFSDKPYLVVNSNANQYIDAYKGSLVIKGDFLCPSFANENQFTYWPHETPEILIKYFEKIYNSFDIKAWEKEMNNIQQTEKINDWLR